MKQHKLSREELIKIIQEVDRDCAGEGFLKDGYKRTGLKQIKSLLTPIPEEKKTRIIQKYSAEIMTCADYSRAMGLMRQALKEYDALKEGKEE